MLNALRQRWQAIRRARHPASPYEVTCPCGRVQAGLRLARSQVLRCPGCGESVFILPRSPLPPVAEETGTPTGPGVPCRSLWVLPLAAALLTLGVVAAVYFLLFSSLLSRESPTPSPRSMEGDQARRVVEEGRRLLRAGHFQRACNLLETVQTQSAANPELRQLVRQAEILANLSQKSLEEIIEDGQKVGDEKEWSERFKKYRGQSVLFDDVVRRDHKGQHALTVYEVVAGGEKAIVRLDLKLLDHLPLDQPRRLIFGARLDRVAREAGGVWVIRFDSDSGTLLTEEEVLARCGVPLDAEVREVLRRQKEWIAGIP
jgi:hypothetical protein